MNDLLNVKKNYSDSLQEKSLLLFGCIEPVDKLSSSSVGLLSSFSTSYNYKKIIKFLCMYLKITYFGINTGFS